MVQWCNGALVVALPVGELAGTSELLLREVDLLGEAGALPLLAGQAPVLGGGGDEGDGGEDGGEGGGGGGEDDEGGKGGEGGLIG